MSDTPAAGPRLRRGVKKEPDHKPSKVKERVRKARDVIFGEGHILGNTRNKLIGIGLALGLGGAWCGVSSLRTSLAEKAAEEKNVNREREEREAHVDEFIFKVKAQMVNGKPTVKFSWFDLHIDKCETTEGHNLDITIGTPVEAGEGFWKFKIMINGTAHGKTVKYEVAENIFADGAERKYECTVRRVQ